MLQSDFFLMIFLQYATAKLAKVDNFMQSVPSLSILDSSNFINVIDKEFNVTIDFAAIMKLLLSQSFILKEKKILT